MEEIFIEILNYFLKVCKTILTLIYFRLRFHCTTKYRADNCRKDETAIILKSNPLRGNDKKLYFVRKPGLLRPSLRSYLFHVMTRSPRSGDTYQGCVIFKMIKTDAS